MAQHSEDPPGLLKRFSSILNQFILKRLCVCVCARAWCARISQGSIQAAVGDAWGAASAV